MTAPVAGDVCTPSTAAGSAEQLPLPQEQYQLYDPMGQSRASDLFDLTSTVTDDSDSQFMNLGGAIDQHTKAMGIDDDPVSIIDLSALNQLFNNVLAPTFSHQRSTSTQQLPSMLLQQ